MHHAIRSSATPRGRVAALIVTLVVLASGGLLLRSDVEAQGPARPLPTAGERQALSSDEGEVGVEARTALPSPATGDSQFVALVRIRPRRARMTSARPIVDTGEVELAQPSRLVASGDSCETSTVTRAAPRRATRTAAHPHDPQRAD